MLGGGHGRSCFRAHVRWEPRLHGGEEGQTSSSLGPGGMRDVDRWGGVVEGEAEERMECGTFCEGQLCACLDPKTQALYVSASAGWTRKDMDSFLSVWLQLHAIGKWPAWH